MSRSRVALSVDETLKIIMVRYVGAIEGDEINSSLLDQMSQLQAPWTYDTVIDMRRYDNTVLAPEIENLSKGWNALAQGRDAGHRTAIVSNDPLVKARGTMTQALFPLRTLAYFDTFDEGLDWLKEASGTSDRALAS